MKKIRRLMIVLVLCTVAIFAFGISAQASTKKPAKPKITSVKKISNRVVQIKWKKAKYAKKYQVYVSVNGGKYKRIKTTKSRTYKYVNIIAGTTYRYKICAINGKKKSKFSKVKTVKLPVVKVIKESCSASQVTQNTGTNTLKPTSQEPQVIEAMGVSLDKASIIVSTKEPGKITATVYPENATDKSVSWVSLNNNIATVDDEGNVFGVSPGTTSIVAMAGGKVVTCDVTVFVAVEKFRLSSYAELLQVGSSKSIQIVTTPSDAQCEVECISENERIVTVKKANPESKYATIKGIAPGKANITVKIGDLEQTICVQVTKQINVESADTLPKRVYASDSNGSNTIEVTKMYSSEELHFGTGNQGAYDNTGHLLDCTMEANLTITLNVIKGKAYSLSMGVIYELYSSDGKIVKSGQLGVSRNAGEYKKELTLINLVPDTYTIKFSAIE